MSSSRLSRIGAWLGACALALLTSVALPTGAAHAARIQPRLEFEHAALEPGAPVGKGMFLSLVANGPFTLHDVTATLDVAHLAGVAKAEIPITYRDVCKQAGTVITCTIGALSSKDLGFVDHGFAIVTYLDVTPLATAKVDDEGSVAVKLTSRDSPAMTRTAKVTIAEGVTLRAGEHISRTARPGETISVPPQVTNAGDNPVTGVDLFFYIDPWYTVAHRFANCQYASGGAFCHFDSALKPHTTYRLSQPVAVTVRRDIPAPTPAIGVDFEWTTPIDDRDNVERVRSWGATPGAGAAATLVEVPAPRPQSHAQMAQTNPRGLNDQALFIQVTGVQTSDVAAVGARAHGAVGASVTTTVGAKNLGPAFVMGFEKPAVTITVTPPKGTTVLSTPEGCVAAKATYVCSGPASRFDVGRSIAWKFPLRIDAPGQLVGTVVAKNSDADGNAANNSAQLVVNPVGGDGGGGDGTGTLPVTGAPAQLIGVAGLMLVAGGAFALVVARRRRRAPLV
jgi:LPXTG-motif cell wall-anchored protein